MSVPLIYKTNENGVVLHPTEVWSCGKFKITVGTTDGYFWASGSSGTMSDRGWGSPVVCSMYWLLYTSREEAELSEARFVYRQLLINEEDCLKKDVVEIKKAKTSLLEKYPDISRLSINLNVATLATLL